MLAILIRDFCFVTLLFPCGNIKLNYHTKLRQSNANIYIGIFDHVMIE